ncbi:MAG: hypothetical protein OXG13_03280 [Gemmatimonadaceae bacterium]|nr:hypothetical protein [Gemmatimonadaceae bacterium]
MIYDDRITPEALIGVYVRLRYTDTEDPYYVTFEAWVEDVYFTNEAALYSYRRPYFFVDAGSLQVVDAQQLLLGETLAVLVTGSDGST